MYHLCTRIIGMKDERHLSSEGYRSVYYSDRGIHLSMGYIHKLWGASHYMEQIKQVYCANILCNPAATRAMFCLGINIIT